MIDLYWSHSVIEEMMHSFKASFLLVISLAVIYLMILRAFVFWPENLTDEPSVISPHLYFTSTLKQIEHNLKDLLMLKFFDRYNRCP